jgi:hypothetical protein
MRNVNLIFIHSRKCLHISLFDKCARHPLFLYQFYLLALFRNFHLIVVFLKYSSVFIVGLSVFFTECIFNRILFDYSAIFEPDLSCYLTYLTLLLYNFFDTAFFWLFLSVYFLISFPRNRKFGPIPCASDLNPLGSVWIAEPESSKGL